MIAAENVGEVLGNGIGSLRRAWWGLGCIGFVVGALSVANLLAPEYFPSIGAVLREIYEGLDQHRYLSLRSQRGWRDAIQVTAITTAGAIAAGGAAGLLMPLLLWPVPRMRFYIRHAVDLLRVVPPLVAVPFFLCVLAGRGRWPSWAASTLYAFLGSVVYAYANIEQSEGRFQDFADLHGLRGVRRAILIRLPAGLPGYLGHLQIILSLTLGIVIVAEYFQDRGLGFALRSGQDKHSLSTIAATILLSVLLLASLEAVLNAVLPVLRLVQRLQWRYATLRFVYVLLLAGRNGSAWLRRYGVLVVLGLRRACALWKRIFKIEPVPLVDGGTFLVTLIGVTVTVVGFWIVWSQLDQSRVSQAWQTLVGAAGKRGGAGRVRALERLIKSRQHLTSADLSSGLYQQAEFSSGAFDEANFDGATLRDVRFLGSNLFKVTFRRATITGSLFGRCNFSNGDFGGSAEITDTVFTAFEGAISADNAGGEQVIFRGARLRKVQFRGVSLSGADFRDVVGTNVSFSDCNLHGSRFNKAQLRAQFADVRANQATIFTGAVLEGSKFINSELRSCDFSSANLRETTFANTTMSAIRFMGADLRGAHLNMPGVVDENDWEGYIQNIRLANIAGVDAPKGFHEWAISRGAVDEPTTDGWEALRKKEGLQPMYEPSGALMGLDKGRK